MQLDRFVVPEAPLMDGFLLNEVTEIIVNTLGIQDRAHTISAESPLFGSLPELDSLGVVELGLALEIRFGFEMIESDFTAEIFETVGTLTQFVERKQTTQIHRR